MSKTRLIAEDYDTDAAAPETATERDRLRAVNAELVAALRSLADAFVNPGDGAPFEDGEVPVLDAARTAIARAGGRS